MKKILASAGLVALGAATIQAAPAPGLSSVQTTKPWSVSATLRGFYDDNYATLRNDRRDSFGIEVSPSAALNLVGEQTYLGASYKYGMRWYEDRENNSADHSHQFSLQLDHQFSERYRMKLYNDFVIAQEGYLIDPAQRIQALRLDTDNMRNTAGVEFRMDMSPTIAIEPGYTFTIYDYEETGPASYSARLDRYEHLAKLALRWKEMWERTDGILGYQFGVIDYNSKDTLDPTGATMVSPSVRDNKSHYYFVGVDHTFTKLLTLSLRVGGQTVDYRGNVSSKTSPYVDLSATYQFQEASSLQAGYKFARIPTDQLGWIGVPTNVTTDQLAHFFYLRVNHTIGGRLTLSGGAQYQYGSFRGGDLNSSSESYAMLDLSASYRINPFLSAETGYMHELLNDHGWAATQTPRDFHRNYLYIGLRATY